MGTLVLALTSMAVRAYTESELYTQLSHLVRLLDVDTALDAKFGKAPSHPAARVAYATSPEASMRSAVAQTLAPFRRAMDGACTAVRRIREASAYRYVNLRAMLQAC